jgi:hypothetical protein
MSGVAAKTGRASSGDAIKRPIMVRRCIICETPFNQVMIRNYAQTRHNQSHLANL